MAKKQEEQKIIEEKMADPQTASELYEEREAKKRRRRIRTVIIVLSLAGLFLAFGLLAEHILPEDSWVAQIAQDNIVGVMNIFSGAYDALPQIFRSISAIFIAFIAYKVVFIIIAVAGSRGGNRSKTITDLVQSLAKYVAIIATLITVFAIWGVDLGTMLAGVGVLGLIIGFGAQSLVADLLAGLFIIFENSFQVGDIITFGTFRGEVKHIGLRTTKVLAPNGDIQIINNSEIRVVINMSQKQSVAVCNVTIEYGADISKVEKLITDNAATIASKIETALGVKYLGAVEFNDSGVLLRIIADCDEGDRLPTERALNREIKLLFDKNKVAIAVPNRKVANAK